MASQPLRVAIGKLVQQADIPVIETMRSPNPDHTAGIGDISKKILHSVASSESLHVEASCARTNKELSNALSRAESNASPAHQVGNPMLSSVWPSSAREKYDSDHHDSNSSSDVLDICTCNNVRRTET